MSSRFFDAAPYILAAGAILLGAFEIIKDWKDYKDAWLRMAVATVFVVVGGVSIASLYHDGREKKESDHKRDQEMQSLRAETEAANVAQANNTKLFLDSFNKMSGQVSDLKTQVKTEALQKKLGDVQTELAETREALAPAPKADLDFTFVPFTNGADRATVALSKEVTLPLNADGSVHFEFSPANLTTVDTADVAINFYICGLCRYAKEPSGLTKTKGEDERERFLNIAHLHAMEFFGSLGVDVFPPPGADTITVGFTYRCQTCVIHLRMTSEASGTIHILRAPAN